jgi:hypothetical protein
MTFFVIASFVVLILASLGSTRTWPALNRWSFVMYAGFALAISLELLAAWSHASISESDYAAGLAVNVANARRNMYLAHQSVVLSLAATCLVGFSAMIYWLKVRWIAA